MQDLTVRNLLILGYQLVDPSAEDSPYVIEASLIQLVTLQTLAQ